MEPSKIVDAAWKLIDNRGAKRQKFYEDELSKAFNEIESTNRYFVEELTELVEMLAHLEQSDIFQANDFDGAKIAPLNEVRTAVDKIENLRMKTRSERIKLRSKADVSMAHSARYFNSAILKIVSDEERLALKDFCQSIQYYFHSDLPGELHDLASAIEYVRGSIERLLAGSKLPKAAAKEMIKDTKRQVENHRQRCFASWQLVSRKFHAVEALLKNS